MHAVVSIGLLIAAVAGLLTPRLRAVQWLTPVVLAGVALASGIASTAVAEDAVRPLLAPLAFVLLAVPMAVMLDRYGLFEELAQVVAGGRRYLGGLWVLAALVTALLNLDAAVVLLSPLYVRIAERREASRLALALQPALLSALASSALPISNLTNLIAVGRLHLSTWGFVEHLGLPRWWRARWAGSPTARASAASSPRRRRSSSVRPSPARRRRANGCGPGAAPSSSVASSSPRSSPASSCSRASGERRGRSPGWATSCSWRSRDRCRFGWPPSTSWAPWSVSACWRAPRRATCRSPTS